MAQSKEIMGLTRRQAIAYGTIFAADALIVGGFTYGAEKGKGNIEELKRDAVEQLEAKYPRREEVLREHIAYQREYKEIEWPMRLSKFSLTLSETAVWISGITGAICAGHSAVRDRQINASKRPAGW